MAISTIGSNSLNQTSDLTINGQTVGKGGGNVATNTAHGASALAVNTSGSNNTAVGYQAGYSNTTGANLTAFGYQSLYTNSTGIRNAAFGMNSLFANTTGSYNAALSYDALQQNTTGSNNVAVGYQSLISNTTASNNTAVGYQAGYSTVTAQYNTFFGEKAGYAATGGFNTLLGAEAGLSITSGTKNTVIGTYSGNQGGLDIRTASNYIVLSDGDGNPRITVDNSGLTRFGHTNSSTGSWISTRGIGRQAYLFTTAAANGQDVCNVGNTNGGYSFNAFRFWNGELDVGSVVGSIACTTSATSYNTSSDYRLKNTIAPMTGALAKVQALKPVTYKWNADDSDGEGFIAHELAEVCPHAVTGAKDAIDEEGKPVYQGIDTSFLVATLTAAIKELKALVDAQATEIAELKAKVA